MDDKSAIDSQDEEEAKLVDHETNESSETRARLPWLLSYKVELPGPTNGYVERPELDKRCPAMERRLTVLQAPGGFGKTALLAHRCRRLREDGVLVAWLSVDEQDGPIELANYLEFAFQRAGVRTIDSGEESRDSDLPDVETDIWAEYRINRLIRLIDQQEGAQCLLVLDELERMRNRASTIAVLNTLLRSAPRNLRFAMAYRERPPGLDIAMLVLEDRAELVTAEDLRFSTAEISNFFQTRLPRAELVRVAERSAGWPIALRLYRNARESGLSKIDEGGQGDTISAWIESRFWRSLSADDREFVLDISLFDWIDPKLIDEATGSIHSRQRIESMVSLTGLLQTTGGEVSTLHLHPLIREYCALQRFRENPERFRTIHAEIAKALARRGHVVEAMRHAAEAGDSHLVGRIAEAEGGIELWFRRGLDAIRAVDGWLTSEVISIYPRLALLRCAVLAVSGNMEGASRVYDSAALDTAGFSRNVRGEKDEALQIDHMLVLGMMHVWRCTELSQYEPLISAALRLPDEQHLDPVIRGMLRYGLCLSLNEMSEFGQAEAWLERARADLGRNTLYLTPHIDIQVGIAAMAQGRAERAADAYRRALIVSGPGQLGDATTVTVAEVLTAELAFERSTGKPRRRPPMVSARLLSECGVWLDVYAASVGVTSELAMEEVGVESALSVVENALEFARETDRRALVKIAAALRVSLLVESDRVDEAEKAWLGDTLPVDQTAILDFKSHRWREVEAIACARVTLLTARGEFEQARCLAEALCEIASERQLIRTLMRSTSLLVQLEHRAKDPDRATAHLIRYLRLYSQADYARPLARMREVVLRLLIRIVEGNPESAIVESAARMRRALKAPTALEQELTANDLSGQELEVLRLLGSNSDKEIAEAVNLTFEGVRYRIRRIFAKLDAKGRHDAVHRARELGVLPPEVLTRK